MIISMRVDSLKDSGNYLIQNERNLLRLFAAKNPWTVLYFVLPYTLLTLYLARNFNYSLLEMGTLFIASILYWSLAEYIIHRFFFHLNTSYKTLNYMIGSFHLYHHKNPDDLQVINSGWFTALFGLFLHGSIFYLITFSIKYSLALIIGTLIVYYYYEWIHYLVHQRVYNKGFMKYYQDFHLTHHVKAKKNFGQITPIWDYVFKTQIKNLDTRQNKSMLKFIKKANDARA